MTGPVDHPVRNIWKKPQKSLRLREKLGMGNEHLEMVTIRSFVTVCELEAMAHEKFVDLPNSKKKLIFHSYVNVYQRV